MQKRNNQNLLKLSHLSFE